MPILSMFYPPLLKPWICSDIYLSYPPSLMVHLMLLHGLPCSSKSMSSLSLSTPSLCQRQRHHRGTCARKSALWFKNPQLPPLPITMCSASYSLCLSLYLSCSSFPSRISEIEDVLMLAPTSQSSSLHLMVQFQASFLSLCAPLFTVKFSCPMITQ